jgi:hypothetical protein
MTENLRIPLSVANLIGTLFLAVGSLRGETDLRRSGREIGIILFVTDSERCAECYAVYLKWDSCCVMQSFALAVEGGRREIGREVGEICRIEQTPTIHPYTIDCAKSRSSVATGVNKCLKLNYFATTEQPLWSSCQSFWLQIQRSRIRFPALLDFLRSSGSGTGFTQPREYNREATWKKK